MQQIDIVRRVRSPTYLVIPTVTTKTGLNIPISGAYPQRLPFLHSPILWAPSIYATFAGSAKFAYS